MNFKITQISALQFFQLIRFSTLLLIGVVFTKSGLPTSEIGQYETFLFLAGAVSFFWLNGLIQGFLPSVDEKSISGKSPVLFNLFYLLATFSGLAVLFILIFEKAISGHLLHGSQIPFLNYLIVYILISSPASLVEYIYLIKKQGRNILIYGYVTFVLMFLLVVLPPVLGYSIEYSMIGLVISSAIRLVWLLVLLFQNSKPNPDFLFIRKHLKCAFPLVFSMFLSGSAQYIDGFIITSYFDDATFAVFRFGAREFPLVLLLANAFSSSMLPGFADRSMLKSNLETIRQNSQKLGFWLFPLSGVLMLLSHWAFPVIFNVSFAASATIFNIYLLLIVSRLLFPQTILIGLRKTNAIMWASFLEIVVNVILSLWFVQFWGLAGVAYGTVCAYVFEKVVLTVFVRKSCGFSLSAYLNVKQHLLYSLLLLTEFIVIEYLIY
ncbi:MAG: polysaccharide biosynthesis C-terminal domain-containing protein [Prolixibacteraceae bacterium]|nr:polysaccharide biosynthesis C-terminal domain-containing protein [Prolixibacteraceae bacterium]